MGFLFVGPFFFAGCILSAQEVGLRGQVVDRQNGRALEGVRVVLEGASAVVFTDSRGRFDIRIASPADSLRCRFDHEGYHPREFHPLSLSRDLDLGLVHLEQELEFGPGETAISLSESDVFEEDVFQGTSGFLHAGRDVFLNRAAFDFSPAFFRLRGLDNRNAAVYLNGIPVNRFSDGRPQWNSWGGLNDVTRNPEYHMGLEPVEAGMGGVTGTTLMEISPVSVREGFRLTMSAANRNYAGRLMATYNSGLGRNGWGFMTSLSTRRAAEGYMEGTPYAAFSVLGALMYRPNQHHEISLVGVYASNLRGRSSALTGELLSLGGRAYNPYWGYQEGNIRNSRMRYIAEPFAILRYRHTARDFRYTAALGYRQGMQYRTRLAYFNAPNPDPAYYRNLPSFYFNNPVGPNLISAAAAREGFLSTPQVDWGSLYEVNQLNSLGKASYILQADCSEEAQFTANTYGAWDVDRTWKVRGGILFQNSKSSEYGRLDDLLGASFHEDADPFSQTRNDVGGSPRKETGDRIGHDYAIGVRQWQAFAGLEASGGKWNAYLYGQYGATRYQRTGAFLNEKYPEASMGPGKPQEFADHALKWGGDGQITGRHWLRFRGAYLRRPPVLRNTFVNPRERHGIVPNLAPETLSSAEVSYFLRGMNLTSRLTGYYTRIMDQARVNFFFSDTGYGSAFVQEVTSGLDVLHKGLELGLELDLGPSVQLSAVAALGDFRYASDPDVDLYFLPGDAPGDLREPSGNVSLGPAALKGRNAPAGPSRALGLGMHYRGRAYWWVGTTLSFLSHQYPSPAFLKHTRSFLLDPETGVEVGGFLRDVYSRAIREQALPPVYLLNVTGGKSWKRGTHYISLFISIANVLDAFYLSGGYESGRNGNLRQWHADHLSGSPSFGTRFWPGFGRTFFLNLSWSFL